MAHCCAEGIFGGGLLGVRSSISLAFYDWETTDLIRRIEIIPKTVRATDKYMACIYASLQKTAWIWL